VIAFTNIRALRAVNMRRRGVMLKDIAEEFGVTTERARQLSKLGQEVERRTLHPTPWDELSARVRNALTMDGCDPKAEAVAERYVLDPYLPGIPILRVLNIGRTSVAEIQHWLVRHGQEPLK
jgi:hypothetical protein